MTLINIQSLVTANCISLVIKNGAIPASFCLFSSFPNYTISINFWKHRWCAWDSNLGQQVGGHRWIHWAMAAPDAFHWLIIIFAHTNLLLTYLLAYLHLTNLSEKFKNKFKKTPAFAHVIKLTKVLDYFTVANLIKEINGFNLQLFRHSDYKLAYIMTREHSLRKWKYHCMADLLCDWEFAVDCRVVLTKNCVLHLSRNLRSFRLYMIAHRRLNKNPYKVTRTYLHVSREQTKRKHIFRKKCFFLSPHQAHKCILPNELTYYPPKSVRPGRQFIVLCLMSAAQSTHGNKRFTKIG